MKNKGFTLIELLIVIALMGIVYGIYFFTKKPNKTNSEFTLGTMKEYMSDAKVKYGDNLQLVYYLDKKVIYLTNDKYKLFDTIDFDKSVTQYLLKQNENLEVARYKSIEIDDVYFEPTFIYKIYKKDLFSYLILHDEKNRWLYFDTYFNKKYHTFENDTELVNFIKKKEYLPMYAGKPE